MKRIRHLELMDDPAIGPAAHEHALASLNRINWMLGAHRKLYGYLAELGDPGRMSMVDLGAGGGGFLGHIIELRKRGRGGASQVSSGQDSSMGQETYLPEHGQDPRATQGGQDGRHPEHGRDNRPPVLVGVDFSHFALSCARRWQGPEQHGVVGDVRRVPLADASADAVTCQLLLHHFEEPDVVAILGEAARVARRGIVVADLSRSTTAWALTWITTRLVSRSSVFHHDGPRSVRAAYRARELAELAERAGLRGARVKSVFPFRLVLVWRKD